MSDAPRRYLCSVCGGLGCDVAEAVGLTDGYLCPHCVDCGTTSVSVVHWCRLVVEASDQGDQEALNKAYAGLIWIACGTSIGGCKDE